MKNWSDHPLSQRPLSRRDALTLIGAGGLVLTFPLESLAAPMTTPTSCGPIPPCPTTKPPTPGGLDVSKLPPLGQFIAALSQSSPDAQANRRNFNNCPDAFFKLFELTQADAAALIDFKDHSADALKYVKKQLGGTQEETEQFNKLEPVVKSFYPQGWKNLNPPDCYDGPNWCPGKVEPQYARPDSRVIDVDSQKDASTGITTLTVTAEGVVPEFFTMGVILNKQPPQQVLLESPFVRDPASTFRCSKLVGSAKLETGKKYRVQLMIGGLERVSKKFTAA